MTTLNEIRARGERDMADALAKLDRRHRAIIEAANEQYGSVRAIPESLWEEIRRDMESETAAIILLLLLSGDEWTESELAAQGVTVRRAADQSSYALDAARRSQQIAAQTTDTLRDRLARKVEDVALTGPGSTGTLTKGGIASAVGDVFTPERRSTIATDVTTTSLSRGQIEAARRIGGGRVRLGGGDTQSGGIGGATGTVAIGGDGAATIAGQKVSVELLWSTERDDRVCPRCAPLDNQPEKVWGLVFPDGPGPECHPNCRCSLRPVVVVSGGGE